MARAYAAYRRWSGADGRAETMIVSDGFVWGAAMFGPLWAIVFGRWRAAAFLGAGWTLAGFFAWAAGPVGASIIWPLTAYWSGLVARGLEALYLDDQGWRLEALAVARDADAAEARLVRRDAERADGAERRW